MKFRMSRYSWTLLFIVATSAAALLVDLPKIPLKFAYGPININTSIGGYAINLPGFIRDLKIKKGLDLSGGVQIVYKADMTGITQSDQATALDAVKAVIDRRVNFFGVSEPLVQTSHVGSESRITVELPGLSNVDEALKLIGKTAVLDFRELQGASESAQMVPTGLTGKELKSAALAFAPDTNEPEVSIVFTDTGATKFQEITKRNVGKPLAIYLDDQLVSAPNVNQEISGGQAVINGKFTVDQAKSLAIQLSAGALPVPISLISQKQVSATLGTDSVQKSIFAGLVGLLIVGIFMIGNYGKLGILADVALIIYGVISLAVYKLVPVTLTLAGVAGFLLSIGMAVDANILIFERIKEERRMGRPRILSLELGFKRAWESIRDANVCTLITCFVLFNPFNWSFLNVSGLVRGFALTLALGIAISLFTGIVVTRTLVRLFYR
ncbi:MAG: protein translocase subunit SecD [candidate division WWE3 bacterium]|nr:protein translocase subunit SecD [candidate division WWE3 bacterium]